METKTSALLGVISDTHIPGRGRKLPGALRRLFEGADLILHAGDFVDSSVLFELGTIAPVRGVLGNCDTPELSALVPLLDTVELAGVRIGMIHDSGSRDRRRQRMAARFPHHRVVIFGHSHNPIVEDDGSLLLLNPGSACDPRSARIPTVAILKISDGSVQAELVEV